MGRGEEKLATQVGPKGYFGQLTLEAEPITENVNHEVEVEFDPSVSKRCQSGAAFGNEYVLEHMAKRKVFPNGGRIRVISIGGLEVDTNNVVIALIAAPALSNALGIQPRKLPFWTAIQEYSAFRNS